MALHSDRTHAPLQVTSGNTHSVGLSLEVSLRSALVGSHRDCDIAEYSWLCCVNEKMSLRDVPIEMP